MSHKHCQPRWVLVAATHRWLRSHTQGLDAQPSESAWPTLRKEGNGHVAIPIQDGREIEKNQNGLGVADEGAPAYTIDQTGAQAVAYGIQGNMIGRQDHNGPGGQGP
jgi:hypothetical protein